MSYVPSLRDLIEQGYPEQAIELSRALGDWLPLRRAVQTSKNPDAHALFLALCPTPAAAALAEQAWLVACLEGCAPVLGPAVVAHPLAQAREGKRVFWEAPTRIQTWRGVIVTRRKQQWAIQEWLQFALHRRLAPEQRELELLKMSWRLASHCRPLMR